MISYIDFARVAELPSTELEARIDSAGRRRDRAAVEDGRLRCLDCPVLVECLELSLRRGSALVGEEVVGGLPARQHRTLAATRRNIARIQGLAEATWEAFRDAVEPLGAAGWSPTVRPNTPDSVRDNSAEAMKTRVDRTADSGGDSL